MKTIDFEHKLFKYNFNQEEYFNQLIRDLSVKINSRVLEIIKHI